MLQSPKTEVQGNPYGLHTPWSRNKKDAFKWPHAKLRQYSKLFAMPTANRNTEVSYGVSRGYQQKQILRVTIEQLPVPERS